MRNFIRALWVVGALGAGAVAATSAAAQEKKQSLLITIVQQAPKKGHAEVLLKAAPDARNLVFVDAEASGEDLEAAIDIVRHMRYTLGDTLTRDVRAIPRPATGPKPAPNSRRGKRLAAFGKDLKKLDKREKEDVAGVGRVKSFDLITTAYEKKPPR